MKLSNISIVRRTVVQPRSVGYIKGKLDTPIEGTYMVSGVHNKKALVSNIYGNNTSVILKVVNDSDTFITFKKGKSIGHAESADLVLPSNDHCSFAQASGQAHEETEQDLREI